MLWQKIYIKQKRKKKNNKLVEEIKNRWSNFNDEIKKMSEDEKNEEPDQIFKINEEVLDFNKKFESNRVWG